MTWVEERYRAVDVGNGKLCSLQQNKIHDSMTVEQPEMSYISAADIVKVTRKKTRNGSNTLH